MKNCTAEVQITSVKFIFIQESQATRKPLNVSPLFTSISLKKFIKKNLQKATYYRAFRATFQQMKWKLENKYVCTKKMSYH
jgi:hypothetical protein